MAQVEEFRAYQNRLFEEAQKAGRQFLDLNAGELHRAVGVYPSSNHRMPACCSAMTSEMNDGDTIIASPASGQGASLTIRFHLPR